MNLVAEIGINHHGDEKYVLEYVDKLIDTKIDAITIQYRDTQFYKKYKKFILNESVYEVISAKIKSRNKLFGVAIKYSNKINFFEKINTDFYKIIEKDLENEELMERILLSNAKKIYLSTGMSSGDEIMNVLDRYKKIDKKRVILIHTTLSNKINKVNLESIRFMREKFSMNVAYGSHCEEYKSILISIGYSPESIFFYVKGNKFEKHPDQEYAIDLDFVDKLIEEVRHSQLSIGEYDKKKIFDIEPEKSVENL